MTKLISARELRNTIRQKNKEKRSSEEFRKEVAQILGEINELIARAKVENFARIRYDFYKMDEDIADVVIKKLKRAGYSTEKTFVHGCKYLWISVEI